MIEIGIHQVIKNYGYHPVLNEAGFEVMKGERAALVGRNGSGKTTILKILMQEEQADKGTISIRKGTVIGYLEQIPKIMDDSMTVNDVIKLGQEKQTDTFRKLTELEHRMASVLGDDEMDKVFKSYTSLQNDFISMDGYAMKENFEKIVEGFGIRELLSRKYSVLSGGQKTIVCMASILLKQPDILLLDEPTNHLDVSTLSWFENYLAHYKGTVLYISHDRYFMDKTATKTILLENGACNVFYGNYSYSMRERERLLMLEFEDYKTQQKQIEAMKASIKRYREWGARGDNAAFFRKAKELEKRLNKLEIIERPQLEKKKVMLNFSGDRSGRDIVRLEDFSLRLGNTELFLNAGLLIRYGEKVCLAGANGTGKTSLIKVLLGQNQDYSGTVKLNPSILTGYIPQEVRFYDEGASIIDIFRKECPCSEGEARKILAGYYFYGSSIFKKAAQLSGGEKVLLKLAILVQNQVNFLILDEPTNHIDIEMREMLEGSLSDFEGTLLFISHDRYFIHKLADRVIDIKNKKLVECNEGF